MAFFAKFTERGQRALLAAQNEAAKLGRTSRHEHLAAGRAGGSRRGVRRAQGRNAGRRAR